MEAAALSLPLPGALRAASDQNDWKVAFQLLQDLLGGGPFTYLWLGPINLSWVITNVPIGLFVSGCFLICGVFYTFSSPRNPCCLSVNVSLISTGLLQIVKRLRFWESVA